jgi:hypothetical protein
MALQLGALRDALEAAGANPDAARKAAEEVALFQSDISGLRTEMKTGFAEVQGDMKLLRWMITFNLGLTVIVLGKLFGVVG